MRLLAVRSTAPLVALLLLGCAAGYSASCSGPSGSAPGGPPPKLGKFVPELPTAAPAPPKPTAAPTAPAGPTTFEGTVDQARDQGCTTRIVEGLSRQIIDEANCMTEHAFAELPKLANVELDRSVLPYLASPARDAVVAAAEANSSKQLKINSALRTVVQQYLLYDWYKRGRCGITLAARPGRSNHEDGLAIDISNPERWRRRLRKFGFRWFGKKDRWHFDYRGKNAKKRSGWDVEAFQRLWNRNHPGEIIGEDGDYGRSTEKRMRRAPAAGFAIGAICRIAVDEERQ